VLFQLLKWNDCAVDKDDDANNIMSPNAAANACIIFVI